MRIYIYIHVSVAKLLFQYRLSLANNDLKIDRSSICKEFVRKKKGGRKTINSNHRRFVILSLIQDKILGDQ